MTDLILSSLSKAYDQFVIEFKMSGMEKSVSKLHMMLKAVEASIKGAPATILIAQKNLGKGKGKGKRKADVMDGETKPVTKPNPQEGKARKGCNLLFLEEVLQIVYGRSKETEERR